MNEHASKKFRASQVTDPDPLADALHSAAIHVLRLVRSEDPSSGLTPARLSLLSVIVFAGPLPPRDLAAAEGVKPPTVTKLIQGLQQDGLVRRIPDAEDKRMVRIAATEKGRKRLLEAKQRRIDKLAARLSRIPSEDRHVLAQAVELMQSLASQKDDDS